MHVGARQSSALIWTTCLPLTTVLPMRLIEPTEQTVSTYSAKLTLARSLLTLTNLRTVPVASWKHFEGHRHIAVRMIIITFAKQRVDGVSEKTLLIHLCDDSLFEHFLDLKYKFTFFFLF